MIPQNIPINGRIAIVDDKFEQAIPIMNMFARNQAPYIYYDGQVKNLPAAGESFNDVRLLILDLNLIDDRTRREVEIKSSLIPVVDRIISEHNYPYLLIYWTRHKEDYSSVIEDIFKNDLKNKAPISYLSLNKSEYFGHDGSLLKDASAEELLNKINSELSKFPVYKYLIEWENHIHWSADRTLEEIFKLDSFEDDWNKDTGYVFYKLASAYAGKHLLSAEPKDHVKNAFLSLNKVFDDSLEFNISNNLHDNGYEKLEISETNSPEIIYTLNKKLLLSDQKSPINAPGIVMRCDNEKKTKDFGDLLNSCLNIRKLQTEIRNGEQDISESQIRKRMSTCRKTIRESWHKVFIVATPLCDFVQNKQVLNKIIRGIIIDAKCKEFINASESVFVSPVFRLTEEGKDVILVLDFRHFFSLKNLSEKSITPMFRVRQQLLAEIQSKLSRHISRQGILYLD